MYGYIYVNDITPDPELQNYILNIKKFIDARSAYGKYCKVDIIRYHLDYLVIRICMEINIKIEHRFTEKSIFTSIPLIIGYDTRMPEDMLNYESWQESIPARLDNEFTEQLRHCGELNGESVVGVEYSRVRIGEREDDSNRNMWSAIGGQVFSERY